MKSIFWMCSFQLKGVNYTRSHKPTAVVKGQEFYILAGRKNHFVNTCIEQNDSFFGDLLKENEPPITSHNFVLTKATYESEC
jgi:hypothetical protein